MKKGSVRLQVDIDQETYMAIQFLKMKSNPRISGGVVVDLAVQEFVRQLYPNYMDVLYPMQTTEQLDDTRRK